MRYLIYGAGTIGTAYAWLLSHQHEVDVYVRNEDKKKEFQKRKLYVKDLRVKETTYSEKNISVNCITEITNKYDGNLKDVNRYKLNKIIPQLNSLKENTNYFAFMQNNWNIKEDLEDYFSDEEYIIAFPSSIGGGRESNKTEIIIFDEATRLGGSTKGSINNMEESLKRVNIKTKFDKNIFDWLKVHYLQQSITAGAVLEAGSYLKFANDYKSVKKMVLAFREGINVCKAYGVPTNKIFPSKFFNLPLFIVAHLIQKMFLSENTMEMVENHMKEGLSEWVYGYNEVLKEGLKMEISMHDWASYEPYIMSWLKKS